MNAPAGTVEASLLGRFRVRKLFEPRLQPWQGRIFVSPKRASNHYTTGAVNC